MDIERELEAMGFEIYRRYENKIPTGAWAIRGNYRSTEGYSWQQLRDIVQADSQWYMPKFKPGDNVMIKITLTQFEGCTGTVVRAVNNDEVVVDIHGTFDQSVYTASELEAY